MTPPCRCGCGQSVTSAAIWRAGHNMRATAALGGRHRAGKRLWTAAEDATLRDLFPNTRTEDVARVLNRTYSSTCQRARKLGLKKSAPYLASPAACRLGRGQGGATRFKKGHTPHNKGIKRRPGWAPGRMRETQFKKGEMRGAAQRNWKPIGSERVSKNGCLERKVHDDDFSHLPADEANRRRARRWRAVHLIVWEEAHGPLPAGYAIAFKNGDKRDIRLENLECITRDELMRRNTIHRLPQALVSTIRTLGALKRQIRKRDQAHATEQD